LSEASHKVVQNKGSGGIDRMSVTTWEQKEKKHLCALRHRLINDTYRSKPVKRCYIDKPGERKPTKEEFDQMGLFAMRSIIRPQEFQLMLF
jgi:retron-type reverse transcriptase